METPDFRSYFLIRIKLARTVNEIHGDLLSTFPDSWPGLYTLQRCQTEFNKGVFALEKKTRPGRPRETRTEENGAHVKHLVEDNPRMTTRQVAAEVSLPSTTVFRLLTEDLGLRNLPSVLVPHQLRSQQDAANEVLLGPPEAVPGPRGGLSGVSSVSLGQVLVLLGFSRAEASVGGAHGGPVLDPRVKQIARKTMILMGFTCKSRRVSITALPARTTADRSTMIEDLRTTGKRFLSLKKDKIRLKDCLLMWDNARPPLPPIPGMKQSPYSPDLNLCDSTCSGGHEEATLAVQRAMRRVSEDELYDQLRKLRGHCHDVIAVGGDYVGMLHEI
ncbi:Uncharacterized protein FKW44_006818 [Caligus rogercresseyi]|uniref:Uncharacterized protein n=1 Tax=Caligus rogercresseyi TaxID=217165 RepID=A0A7T8KDW3_CALRO|nr:Uncharacterized protein FKW44_006818 [Caligus rogercresseyi]